MMTSFLSEEISDIRLTQLEIKELILKMMNNVRHLYNQKESKRKTNLDGEEKKET